MAKKNRAIKNLIDSHGWLGVIFSVVLFLVFWTGAISLFRAEIQQWAETPHYQVDTSAEDLPLMEVIDKTVRQYPFDREKRLTVVLPNETRNYHAIVSQPTAQ